MRLLLLLSWPYARKHVLRTVLTVAGIVIGVTVLVGMHSANRAVGAAFRQTVDRIAGKTQLQVTAGEAGFPEEALEKAQALPEVAAAAPVIEAAVNTGLRGQGNLLLLGVDMTGDRSLRDYDMEARAGEVVEDPLVFLAQPDSLILTRRFAARNGLEVGSRIRLETIDGLKQFTVRGLMRDGGLASAFGGNLAVMDIYAAQAVFGRGRMFDRIDIGVAAGVEPEACRRKLEAALGPGYQVEPPEARGTQFEAMARSLSITVNITSLFALVIGVFIIYNSFSIAITQRRAEIGILRALGATRKQVLSLFLTESLAAGVAGSAVGGLLGTWAAGGITGYMGRLVQGMFGTPQWIEEAQPDPRILAAAFAVGVLASLAGGLLPSRAAARVDPVKALQKGRYQVLGAGENRLRRALAVGVFVVAAVCLKFGGSDFVYYTGYILAVLAPLLLAPSLAIWLARLIRPLLRRLRPVEGALAADSLLQAPRRTSATISALMLSLALAVGFAGISGAVYDLVNEWMRARLNPDLFVTPAENLSSRQFCFPASMEAELNRIEGVEEALPMRTARVTIRGVPVTAVAVDLERLDRRVLLSPTAGNRAEMLRLTSAGRGVIISENLALLRDIRAGETLEIPSPGGLLRLPVAGVVVDFSSQQGSFFIDRGLFTASWKDDAVSTFRIYVRKGSDPMAVRQAILDRFSEHRRLFVLTNKEVREFALRNTGQWLAIANVQLAVAVLVAVLGIVNTLTVSITDRRRELGVLRAVGALPGQVRRTIWMEAAAIGLIGVLLGIAIGSLTLYYNLDMLRRDIAGLRLEYQFPAAFSLQLLPLMLGAGWLSSIWPAETAVRASLVESLEYE